MIEDNLMLDFVNESVFLCCSTRSTCPNRVGFGVWYVESAWKVSSEVLSGIKCCDRIKSYRNLLIIGVGLRRNMLLWLEV